MTVTPDQLEQAWGSPGKTAPSSGSAAPAANAAGGASTDMTYDTSASSPLGGSAGPTLQPAGPKKVDPAPGKVTGSELEKQWGPTMQDTDTAPASHPHGNGSWGAAFLRFGLNMAQGLEGTYRGSMGDQIDVKRDASGRPILDDHGNPQIVLPQDKEQQELQNIKDRYAAAPKTMGTAIEDWVEKFVGGLAFPVPGSELSEGAPAAKAVSPDVKLARALRVSGAKLNPVDNPDSGLTGKSIQWAAGKLKTEQNTSHENIKWSDEILRKHFRLEESTPISTETMDAVIDGAGHSYARAKMLPAWKADQEQMLDAQNFGSDFLRLVAQHPKLYASSLVGRVHELRSILMDQDWDGESSVEAVKALRGDARQLLTGGTLRPMAWLEGEFNNKAATALEMAMGRAARNTPGYEDLEQTIAEARKTIAQAYDVRSCIIGDHVNPARLARLQRLAMSRAGRTAGRAALTGAPRLIADGALRFPRSFLSAADAHVMTVGEVGSLMQMVAGAGLVTGHYGMIGLFLGRVGAQSAVRSGLVYLNPYTDTEIVQNAVRVAQAIAKANPVAMTLAAGGASANPQTWPQDPLIALFAPFVGHDEASKLATGATMGTAAWAGAKMLRSHEPALTKSMWEANEFSEAVKKSSGE